MVELFNDKTIIEYDSYAKVNSFISSFDLNINELKLPVDAMALPGQALKGQVITPFNPEFGYQITDEDYDLKLRVKKLLSLGDRIYQEVNPKIAPLFLSIGNSYDYLEKGGNFMLTLNKELLPLVITQTPLLNIGETDLPITLEHFKNHLSKIRLRLFFPDFMTLESRVSYDKNKSSAGFFDFSKFYPADKGPLASSNPNSPFSKMPDGYLIQLPSDLEKLKLIKRELIILD